MLCDRITYMVRKTASIMVIRRGLRNCDNDGTWYAADMEDRDVDGYGNDELP